MKAFVIEGLDNYRVRSDIETVDVGPRDVRIRMKAAGVCRTDLSAINGKWPTPLPCVDGHEGAGIITEVGELVTNREVGQHVILGSSMCGQCFYCTHGAPWFCITKDLGGENFRFRLHDGTPVRSMVGKGTWAEEVVIPAAVSVVIPDTVPFDVASIIGCAVMTGTGQVINVAKPEAGSSAVFFGGGGIGACAVMGAQLVGCATIVVVEPSHAKHEALLRFGATHVVTPDELDSVRNELTDGRGFDYVFENVGRAETLRAAWDSARRGGTVVITGLGGTQGTVDFNLNELSVEGKHLIGNMAGGVVAPRDFPRYCDLYESGKLDLDALITRRLTIDEIPDALHALDHDPTVQRQVIEFVD